jgi:peptidoglycan-associated lipoprotein
MKCTNTATLFVVALVLYSSAVGCHKKVQGTTPLPGATRAGVGTDATPTRPIEPAQPPINVDAGTRGQPLQPPVTTTTTPPGGLPPTDLRNWVEDSEQPFKEDTIYFDYDKSTIKSSQTAKLDRIAAALKSRPGKGLRIEGHCDERGTEEYNRALGERRALAAREYLVLQKGLDASLIDTISYGEDRPAEPGHNEAAWSKNRRDEFILLKPPGGQ